MAPIQAEHSAENLLEILKDIYISPEKRQQIIDKLRLIHDV